MPAMSGAPPAATPERLTASLRRAGVLGEHEIGVVDAAVLALQPDPVGADRPELIDQVRVVGACHDGRHLPAGEPLLDAIRSNAHVAPLSLGCWVSSTERAPAGRLGS